MINKNIQRKKATEKKRISIFQIIILVISVVAVAWVIGSSVERVGALSEVCYQPNQCKNEECCETSSHTCVSAKGSTCEK